MLTLLVPVQLGEVCRQLAGSFSESAWGVAAHAVILLGEGNTGSTPLVTIREWLEKAAEMDEHCLLACIHLAEVRVCCLGP